MNEDEELKRIDGQVKRKRNRWVIIVLIALSLIGVSIILWGKIQMDNQQKIEKQNLEKQRTAAIGFKKVQSGIEQVKFVEQGSYNGAGSWKVSVDVIVDGQHYKEAFNEEGLDAGQSLPKGNTGTSNPIKVVYSNGIEETLK